MKVIIVIKNQLKTQQRLCSEGFSYLSSKKESIICDYDQMAIAAVLKNKGIAATAVAVGGDEVTSALEYSLALGVQKAVRLDPQAASYSYLDEAKMLSGYLKGSDDYLVVFGYKDPINAVAPMLGGLLGSKEHYKVLGLDLSGSICTYKDGREKLASRSIVTMHQATCAAPGATLYDIFAPKQVEVIALQAASKPALHHYKKAHTLRSCQTLGGMEELCGLLKTLEVL